jgi:hypothetical protein
MTGNNEPGSETRSRTTQGASVSPFSRGASRWWLAPLAILAVSALVATAVIVVTQPVGPREITSAISLNFGSDPVTDELNVTYARVSFLSQPTEWNTTGFINGTVAAGGSGVWWFNSSDYGTHYGISEWNSSPTYHYSTVDYHVAGYLGTNVSYIFTDQRFAMNGTGDDFEAAIGESAFAGAGLATSGSVAVGSTGAAQNAIWIDATNVASGNTYTVKAYDWEKGTGTHGANYQNVTTYTFSPAVTLQPLQFYEVYFYANPTQTVLSLVNTTNGAVLSSTAAMHPVFDSNLSKLAYYSDSVRSNGTADAMILDEAYLVDHNVYTSNPVTAIPERLGVALAPVAAGVVSDTSDRSAPFDPSSNPAYFVSPPTSSAESASTSGVNLAKFSTVLNSSSVASETSARINTAYVIPHTSTATYFNASASLTTVRAMPEDTIDSPPQADIWTTSWSPTSIQTQLNAWLKGYIAGITGIPAAQVTIPGSLVSNIAVSQAFSSQAASTIHDFLASAIPGYLANEDLALVNNETGAVDAGAAIGEFMGPGGVIYAPQDRTSSTGFVSVFDPVNHEWYASAEAAGFPVGSSIPASASGAIFVPGQAKFLGWGADGLPIFGPGGCFIICTPSLSGAASAVSNFFGSAATSVSNAVGGVTNTVSQDVIKPVAGSLTTTGTALSTVTSDIAQSLSNVMPIVGGTFANIGGAVTGTISHTLGSVGGSIGSVASSTGGAILSGVNDVTNTIYHVGAAAGSAVASTAGAIAGGLNYIGNTAGKVVSTTAGVLSSAFATTGNILATGAQNLFSAAGNIASDAYGALNTVGSTLVKGATGVWSAISNAFGAAGSAILGAIKGVASAIGSIFSWPTALASNVGTILEYVVIGVVAIALVILVLWLVMRHRKQRANGREIGGERGRKVGHRSRRHHTSTASLGHNRTDRRPAILAARAPV